MTTTALEIPSLKGKVSDEEWAVRVDLAAAYRLVSRYGWEDLVFTHISARVPGTEDQFLINPYGLMFDEITASSLVKIDLQGNKVSESPFPVNPAGFTIHSAIHAARPEVGCVIHLHTEAGMALYDAFYAKQELTTAHVLASLSQTVPLAKTMSEKINAQRSWAVGRARNASVIRPLPAGNDTARHMEL